MVLDNGANCLRLSFFCFIHLGRHAFIAAALLSVLNRALAAFGSCMNGGLDRIVVFMQSAEAGCELTLVDRGVNCLLHEFHF